MIDIVYISVSLLFSSYLSSGDYIIINKKTSNISKFYTVEFGSIGQQWLVYALLRKQLHSTK